MQKPYIELKNIIKTYDNQLVIDISQMSIKKGEILSIIGPSGIGKSTLLRMVAGLVGYDSGEITIDGHSMSNISPQQRPVVYMFQESLLFPHLNLLNNVTFGLKMARVKKRIRNQVGIAMLERMGLKGLTERYPHEISGGQKQRVALARSLIVKPKVLLLDEPFSNLDSELRKDTRRWMKRLLKEEGMTVLFVTHDLEEAMAIGDRVAILGDGKLQQIANPKELYDSPKIQYVTNFLQSGIWKNNKFIAVNRLFFTEDRPLGKQNMWKGEVIETFYKSGNYHTVISLLDTGERLTVEGDMKVNIGNIVYLQEK